MADIINLRTVRKRKALADAAQKAAENRARFGLTPSERQRRDAQAAADQARLKGLRREPVPEPEA